MENVPLYNHLPAISDLNECMSNTTEDVCLHEGQCINTKGSFICQCMNGWSGKICEIGEWQEI
ncbi:hypothetical protein DPMN_141489 [Dreissena polymorpha]|uniref:EGF-like domain-containing protein n=1 Tax=Dreissena polymorpha TaxID=45954 RepID=A0A9D4G9J4_DREPO|nr:hypothetical protein DPMN_141489 [Dreissena polymorpha]